MAEEMNQQQDGWTAGMSQFKDAMEHNLTASRLLMTGAIAVGAAATAYFWDPTRRNAFLENTRRWSEDMGGWWNGAQSSRQGDSGASKQ
jgi:hypothetical protein